MSNLFEAEKFSVRAALSRPFRVIGASKARGYGLIAQDVVSFLILAAGYWAFIFASYLPLIESAERDVAPDPASMMLQMLGIFGFMIAFLLIFLVQDAAWYRLLTGKPGRTFPAYRISVDEGRLALFYLVFVAILYGAIFVLLFIVMMPAMLISFALVGATSDDPETGAASWILQLLPFLMMLLIYPALFYIQARLNPGGALTIARGRLDLLGGWKATKGQSWRVFAAVLLAIAIYVFGGLTAFIPVMVVMEMLDPSVSVGRISLIGGLATIPVAIVMYGVVLIFRGIFAEVAVVQLSRERKQQAANRAAGIPAPPTSV